MEQGSQKTIGLIYFKFLVGHIKVLVALSRNPVNRAAAFFHKRVVLRILDKQPRRKEGGTWDYPPLGEDIQEVGLE